MSLTPKLFALVFWIFWELKLRRELKKIIFQTFQDLIGTTTNKPQELFEIDLVFDEKNVKIL